MSSTLLSAIQFDPNIRGLLVIVTAGTILIGSIYLILATNSGMRNGFLIAGAGLFGWMFLMGLVWWMYGIGLKGRDPLWMPAEINFTRTAGLATPEVDSLPAADSLPDAVETMKGFPLITAIAKGAEGPDWAPETLSNVVTEATPLVLVTTRDIEGGIRENVKKNASDFLAGEPETKALFDLPSDKLVDEIRSEAVTLRNKIEDQLGGWCLLSESDPRRGEAVASADAQLVSVKAFGEGTNSSKYIVNDVFFYGGKNSCSPVQEKSLVGQMWFRVKSIFEPKNPKLLGVVTVTEAKSVTVVPGETPPAASRREGASTVSVIMLRNLGNRRFLPFLFAVGNGLMFAVFAMTLHSRDKRGIAARAEFAAAH